MVIRRPFFRNVNDCISVLVSLLPLSQHFTDLENWCFNLGLKGVQPWPWRGFGPGLEENAWPWTQRCLASNTSLSAIINVRSDHSETRSQVQRVVGSRWELWRQLYCTLFRFLTRLKHITTQQDRKRSTELKPLQKCHLVNVNRVQGF